MNNDKALYRQLINELSKEQGKPFFFLKHELANAEMGFMLTDAALLVGDQILSYLGQKKSGYNFAVNSSRFLPIVTEGVSEPAAFAKVAPVVVYVFDKYISCHHLDLHNFYADACRLIMPDFRIQDYVPWRGELTGDYTHLNPVRVTDNELKSLRPAL